MANEESASRLGRLQAGLVQAGVDLAAIAPTPNMRYLLGFAPLYDERPCMLLVTPGATAFVVPALNADLVEARTNWRVSRWRDEEGPADALRRALAELHLPPGPVVAADDTMQAAHLLLLQELAVPRRSLPAGQLMGPLRICKSPAEIEALALAAAQADRAMQAGIAACRPGATEAEVAEAIAGYFRRDGAELVAFDIVASGPNGGFAHYETGQRRMERGDAIILDIGAVLEGYHSDITRVVQLGRPSAEVARVYQTVLEANRRGREAAIAGARTGDVDRAARQVIDAAGYGPYFLHRTGHGLGLEAHEPPWLAAGTETVLEQGMVFSVEPGIYLPGKFGVRIEDIVVVSKAGEPRLLTGMPHELVVIE